MATGETSNLVETVTGEAARLREFLSGLDVETWAKGKAIGRPVVADKVDADLVVRLRAGGRSWREIGEAHPPVRSGSGKRVRPSVGSIRRAYAGSELLKNSLCAP